MKKTIPILIALLTLSSFVFAENISGRWNVNTNNWVGVMQLSVSGSNVTGSVHTTFDPDGNQIDKKFRIINGRASVGPKGTLKIEFDREGKNQHFYGWFSQNREYIGGFFEGGYEFPWYATRIH